MIVAPYEEVEDVANTVRSLIVSQAALIESLLVSKAALEARVKQLESRSEFG